MEDQFFQELQELQQELNKLKSYTDEIGKAKHSAVLFQKTTDQVILSTQSFLEKHRELSTQHLEQANRIIVTVRQLTSETKQLQEGIAKVDFPNRFDEMGSSLRSLEEVINEQISESKRLQAVLSIIDFPGQFKEVRANFGLIEKQGKKQLESIDNFHQAFEKINFVDRLEKLDDAIHSLSQEIQTTISHIKLAEQNLKDVISSFQQEFTRINFPGRLDKLDTAVSAVNQGVQNAISRIESTERNLKDSLLAFQEKVSAQNRANTILIVANIAASLSILGAVIYQYFK
jgi:phage-related protein